MGLSYTQVFEPILGFSRHSDSDWGACKDSSHSTTGFCFHLSGAAIIWSSKLQTRVADSSTDSKYITLFHAGKEAVYQRQLLTELGIDIKSPTIIHGDNQDAIALSRNPQFHQRTRHIIIREHFVRDMVKFGDINIQYILTSDVAADIITKSLGAQLFYRHRENLGMR